MKKIFAVMLILVMLFSLAACGNSDGIQTVGTKDTRVQIEDNIENLTGELVTEETESGPDIEAAENGTEAVSQEEGNRSNVLIAYFSRVGNMDFDEKVDAVSSASVNMDGGEVAGNAQLLAGMVQQITGGDLFFIETVGKYPADYRGTTDQAKDEQNADARPELASHVENMEVYDTVILVYPNWWGTLPQPVFTFLEEYDFSGKTILPLCTHEGSRLGRSESDITAICPDAQLLEGLSVRGSNAGGAQSDVEEWIDGSGILK